MRFQLTHSYHQDGMHVEVSPGYHSRELEVWFRFVRLAQANGVECPLRSQIPLSATKDLFRKPALALAYLYKPTGTMPQIGDTDRRDERSFLRELGRYFGWEDVVYAATAGEEGHPPERVSACFPEGGYVVMRSGWGEADRAFDEELYLLFDCGTNQPWHAHFDMLNVVATAFGHDLLIDPGRLTYTAGRERNYIKSTSAHNTIVIDGKDQPWYCTPPPPEFHSVANFDFPTGFHDGYREVRHERSVFFVAREYWIVTDRVTGSGQHQVDQYWHLSHDALGKVHIADGDSGFIAPHLLALTAGTGGVLALEEGYVSPQYREKREVPVVRRTARAFLPVIWLTVLYPYEDRVPVVHARPMGVTPAGAGNVGLAIDRGGITDLFFEQEHAGQAGSFGNFSTDARVAFVRMDKEGQIQSLCLIEGSYLDQGSQRVLDLGGRRSDVALRAGVLEARGTCLEEVQYAGLDVRQLTVNERAVQLGR